MWLPTDTDDRAKHALATSPSMVNPSLTSIWRPAALRATRQQLTMAHRCLLSVRCLGPKVGTANSVGSFRGERSGCLPNLVEAGRLQLLCFAKSIDGPVEARKLSRNRFRGGGQSLLPDSRPCLRHLMGCTRRMRTDRHSPPGQPGSVM